MTNFFGINVTKGQESEETDGVGFIVRRLPEEQAAQIRQIRNAGEQIEQKMELPEPLGCLHSVCQLGWFILLMGMIRAGVTPAEGYRNAPGVYWAFGICFIIWLVLPLYGKKRTKNTVQSSDFADFNEQAEVHFKQAMQTLSIPEDAASTDVLAERYVLKNGEPIHRDYGLAGYLNLDLFIYVQDGSLYLANLYQVWEIPLTSLQSMTLVKKRFSFPEWHKSEAPDAAQYKPYGITTDQFGNYFARAYRLELRDMHGEFYLMIPEFDGKLWMELTLLSPTLD